MRIPVVVDEEKVQQVSVIEARRQYIADYAKTGDKNSMAIALSNLREHLAWLVRKDADTDAQRVLNILPTKL